jgi:uncharacterized membrane protein YeaQ/YmgE (transglycosylase-associated protein family)
MFPLRFRSVVANKRLDYSYEKAGILMNIVFGVIGTSAAAHSWASGTNSQSP